MRYYLRYRRYNWLSYEGTGLGDKTGIPRQTQEGASGDTRNYGHGRGSAHIKVE